MCKFAFVISAAAVALISAGPSRAGEQIRSYQDTTAPAADTGSGVAKQAAEAGSILSAADLAIADQLRSLVENKLQHYVPNRQDRAGVEAFYRKRSFAPLWVGDGKPLPRIRQATEFLQGVAADGLDPQDYPTPRFTDADPSRRAADDLALTNAVLAFVRHASTGRVAFSRVSGSVYFDVKAPEPEQVLERVSAGDDLRAILDSFNPQQPQYKALKAELALARRSAGGKPDTARIDTIVANMERWRWLPRELGPAHVLVNAPDYTLQVVNQGRTAWSTRIVVGKPGKYSTPLLTETMKYITVNPTWNVPPSIIRNEYLPALARDPGALARTGLKMGRNSDGSIRIYQPPGERNALGRIRFNFPNRFLVYQHDTPQKHLFEKAARAYSHGCMRVQNPDRYAEVLLSISQPEDGYSAQRIRSLYGADERTINLKTPIPVYITYQTAFVDDAGRLQIRPDIYGLDSEITNVLKRDSAVADIPVARNYSAGSEPVQLHMVSRIRNRGPEDYFSRGWTPGSFQRGPAPSLERHGVW
jgi:murein L,D-transpeptidase YcbB/YkuD